MAVDSTQGQYRYRRVSYEVLINNDTATPAPWFGRGRMHICHAAGYINNNIPPNSSIYVPYDNVLIRTEYTNTPVTVLRPEHSYKIINTALSPIPMLRNLTFRRLDPHPPSAAPIACAEVGKYSARWLTADVEPCAVELVQVGTLLYNGTTTNKKRCSTQARRRFRKEVRSRLKTLMHNETAAGRAIARW